MRRVLKWALVFVAVVAVCGFGAFLYFIPPFFTTPPEEFGKALADAAPDVSSITDPAERAIAARGRYLVMTTGCIGCHATNGSQGPDLTRYLAGGALKIRTPQGIFVSRNLTPDPETGIGRRTDDELVERQAFALREDRHAVVVYLRHLPPIAHRIPDPVPGNAITIPGAIEQDYAARDYGIK